MFEAEAKVLTFLSEAGVVKIPFFQRRYVWKEENWSDLYDNFFDSEIPGFLGSIILKGKKKIKVTDPSECSVIDGQQRLTTLSIFVMALYDTLNENDKKYFYDDLKNVIFRKNNTQDENGNPIYVPRVVHSHLDKSEFDKVINLYSDNKISETNPSLINQCYAYFYKRFLNEDYETKKKLFNKLITTQILVVISISDDADEQKVFDTLNSAGVRLTMADTIKNYLFNRVSIIIDGNETNDFSEKVINLYNSKWKKCFCEDDNLDKLWNKEFITGRIKRTNIDMFLHCYATIKELYNPTQTLSDLPNVYKSYINTLSTEEEIKCFLNEMCEYAELYKSSFINRDEEYKYSYSKENVLPRLLFFCDNLGTKTFNPYILYLIKNFSNNSVKLNEELHKIEKIIVLTYLNKNTSRSKNYNKLCVDFIKNSDRINEELTNMEDVDTGIIGLQKITNTDAKVLLFLIELYRRRNPMNDFHEMEFKDSYQLEHIMPETWQTYWNVLPENDEHGNELITIDDKVRYRNSKIRSLGNMTILKDKLNNKIKNKSFDVKIEGIDNIPGIRTYTDFKITTADVIEYYDNGGEWNEERICNRTKELFKEIQDALLY